MELSSYAAMKVRQVLPAFRNRQPKRQGWHAAGGTWTMPDGRDGYAALPPGVCGVEGVHRFQALLKLGVLLRSPHSFLLAFLPLHQVSMRQAVLF